MDTKALRQKILDLAIRGKLVPQDPNDEPASVLLERIREQKKQMVKEGKLKAKDIKNDTIIFVGEDNLHYEKFQDGTVKCIEDEIPFEVPERWAWARLDSISEIITKGASPKWQGVDYTTSGTLFVTSENVGADTLLLDSPKFLSDRINEIQPRSVLKKHDILTNIVGASIGRTCEYTLDDLANTNQAVAIIRLVDLSLVDFIIKCLSSSYCIGLMLENQVNVARANLSLSSLANFLIPIPPLNEKQRIMEKVSLMFDHIDTISEDRTTLEAIISKVRSKILDLAIRGKLVPQDPNDEPASILLERIRAEKEELIKQGKIKRDKKESIIFRGDDNSYYHDLPQNWQISTLREITTPLTLNDGDWILSENMTDNGEVKLLQLGSIGNMSYIDKGFKYLTKDTFDELSCTEIFTGYLIINRIISDKMCCCIVPDIDGTIITTVDTCWIAPTTSYNIKFLMYQLASPYFQSEVLLKATGTTRKRISKNNLIDLHFLLPPLTEQERIVNAVEVLFAKLDRIVEALS